MANAKLHIICGNCGCNHMFKYSINTDISDDTGKEYQYVSIICENCNTIHSLEDNAEEEK
jgi:RNase P subunit RPR2